jgi:hypothetical protein
MPDLLNNFRFINILKQEEKIAADRYRLYKLDPSAGIAIRPRKLKYKKNDEAIKSLIEMFDSIAEPTSLELWNHLRALQYRLMNNGFDTIETVSLDRNMNEL